MKRLLVILIVCFSVTQSFAAKDALKDNPRVAEAIQLLEIWLQAERDYEEIPGLSIAVVHDQELVWSQGFGFADLGENRPITAKTIYSICSISKLFTSIAVLQLRDKGLLDLDDPVSKHLPWFQIQEKHADAGKATIRNILTHSSGLPRESAFPYWSAPDFEFPTQKEIMERVSEQATLYPADTYFQYSNLGLTLAGEVVAAASGQSYEKYVMENILKPLGLQDTRPEMPEKLRGKALADGHSAKTRKGVREEVPFFQANGVAAAAGYSSTVEDLVKFASWQFRVLSGDDADILQKNTLREMQRVQWLDPNWRTSWGLGFAVWRSDNKTFVGHGGSCPGFRSQLLIMPKDKIAVAVASNASGVNPRAYAQRAYEILAPVISKASKAEKSESAEEEKPDFSKFTGIYNSQPWGGETAAIIWEGKLAMVGLPSSNPLSGMTKLKHIEDNRFRRIRNDDELGEEFIFQMNDAGEVVSLKRNSNISRKLK